MGTTITAWATMSDNGPPTVYRTEAAARAAHGVHVDVWEVELTEAELRDPFNARPLELVPLERLWTYDVGPEVCRNTHLELVAFCSARFPYRVGR